jgi:hypothetical protein
LSEPTINFGLVLRGLEQYRDLVHLLASSPLVATSDFSYSAPIYKGSDNIKAGLAAASTALEKFDVYFSNALLDETERVRFARLFAQAYLRKFPASERSDLFLASAEVLKIAFELVPPIALQDPAAAVAAAAAAPHDISVVDKLRIGESIDRAHLKFEVRVFLDHVMNPRRREHAEVQAAMRELKTDLPYVLEVVTNGAIPGYVFYAVHPFVSQVGGRLVLLPG